MSILRFKSESDIPAHIQARMRSKVPTEAPNPIRTPDISEQAIRAETERDGKGTDAASRQQGSGLVMLPYPISANRYFRNFRGRMVISSEARSYKKQVTWTFDALGITPSTSDVSLTVKLHPKLTTKGVASRTLIDLDNALKVVFDALQGVLYVNDKQVKKLTAEVGEPVLGGGLSVGIV